jgi:hypothetical protein
MGWLDNSTNNIILDAVLTDFGRQALANQSFSIAKFALGDDEINYGIISKYGRQIGREKIEKNTPVFEAFTNQALGLKYKLVSTPRPLLYLPKLELQSVSPVTLTTSNAMNAKQTSLVTVQQKIQGGQQLDDLSESSFDVYVPDTFLSIQNVSAVNKAADVNRISLYTLGVVLNPGANFSTPTLNFTLSVKTLTNSIFSVYGKSNANGYQINTSVRVVGKNSGAVLDIPVVITSY